MGVATSRPSRVKSPPMRTRCFIVLVAGFLFAQPGLRAADAPVRVFDTPEGGIQPKLAVDDAGTVHLVYYRGKGEGGDLFYVRKERDQDFIKPIRVNSIPRSAIAAGTIRGAQLAIDNTRRPCVVWNSSGLIDEKSKRAPSMFFSRLRDDGSGFEPQRVISGEWSVDGGGAVAADARGTLYVLWHSAPLGKSEGERKIFLRTSTDNGRTFDPETTISPPEIGVCPCCAMQAATDRAGNLYVVFRAANEASDRDITLLTSTNRGVSFQHSTVARWQVQSCPMSSMALAEIPAGILIGWETRQQVYFGLIEKGTASVTRITSPPGQAPQRKHPIFAPSSDGGFLCAWTENTGWQKGGSLAWQLFDGKLQPTAERGNAPGVPTWSFVGAYAEAGDHFVVVR